MPDGKSLSCSVLASVAHVPPTATRLQNSAERVCGRPDIRELKAGVEWEACKDAAIAAALPQLVQRGARLEGTSLAAL